MKIVNNINTLLVKLGNSHKSKIKKDKDYKELKEKVKDYMIKNNKKTIEDNKHIFQLRVSDYSYCNMDDGIINFLKTNNYNSLIKETYDRDKLKDMVKKGKISKSQLQPFMTRGIRYSLNIIEKK